VGFELGEAYRMADIQALVVLDGLGSSHLSRPFPATSLSEAARLSRLTTTPISLGGWSDPRQLENALALHALGAVELDPGMVGLTAACIMADMALGHRLPAWVASTARTAVGAHSDLALAAHPGIGLPSDFNHRRAAGNLGVVLPDAAGCAQASTGLGLGRAPDPGWLDRESLRRADFRP
jgi:L-alanine-DL-glutamate epimerase-like enolase superfamily enzyme